MNSASFLAHAAGILHAIPTVSPIIPYIRRTGNCLERTGNFLEPDQGIKSVEKPAFKIRLHFTISSRPQDRHRLDVLSLRTGGGRFWLRFVILIFGLGQAPSSFEAHADPAGIVLGEEFDAGFFQG